MSLNWSPVFPMVPLLVDITIAVHFLWILFLVFGFVLASKGSRIAFLHLHELFGDLVDVLLNLWDQG